MLEVDWRLYLASDQPGYFEICALDPELAAHLSASTMAVFIDRPYANKILKKHNFLVEQLSSMKMTIERGVAIADKDRHVTFFYKNSAKQYFKASIKVTRNLDEIFLCTFHKIRAEEFQRKMRQLANKPLLREGK